MDTVGANCKCSWQVAEIVVFLLPHCPAPHLIVISHFNRLENKQKYLAVSTICNRAWQQQKIREVFQSRGPRTASQMFDRFEAILLLHYLKALLHCHKVDVAHNLKQHLSSRVRQLNCFGNMHIALTL